MKNIIKTKIGDVKVKYTHNENYNYYEIKLIDLKNNNLIGFVNYKFNYKGVKTAWLNLIKVEDNYQSKGFGNVLLKLFEKECINNRFYNIEGKFFPENDHAKPFYEKNGYKIEKEYYETLVTKLLNENQKIDIEEMCK